MGADQFAKTLALELGEVNIRCNAIAPGAVGGERVERVLEGCARAQNKTLEDEKEAAMSIKTLKISLTPKANFYPSRLISDKACLRISRTRKTVVLTSEEDRQLTEIFMDVSLF